MVGRHTRRGKPLGPDHQHGFSPQMVAAMRAQANATAAAVMAPAMRQLQASNQAVDYFDRTTLRGQIPVSIANQGGLTDILYQVDRDYCIVTI
jgi:hypothetical protein